jgi:large subunit ribosomal protein L21
MYAVIKAGGKQHRVQPGDVIEVELMHGGDDAVQFHPLLVVDDDNKTHVGKELQKATVTATLVGEQKGDKVKVFKYRSKTGYSRRQGHRQMYTLIEIGEIRLPGVTAGKPAVEEPTEEAKAAAPKKSSSKSTAAKTASARTSAATKTAAVAEPKAAAGEDEVADPAPADTPPAEVAEVAGDAETGPESEPAEDTE